MSDADTAPVDAAVRNQIDALADWLEKQGAHVDRKARPVEPGGSARDLHHAAAVGDERLRRTMRPLRS